MVVVGAVLCVTISGVCAIAGLHVSSNTKRYRFILSPSVKLPPRKHHHWNHHQQQITTN
jgi:hypothetical protein